MVFREPRASSFPLQPLKLSAPSLSPSSSFLWAVSIQRRSLRRSFGEQGFTCVSSSALTSSTSCRGGREMQRRGKWKPQQSQDT